MTWQFILRFQMLARMMTFTVRGEGQRTIWRRCLEGEASGRMIHPFAFQFFLEMKLDLVVENHNRGRCRQRSEVAKPYNLPEGGTGWRIRSLCCLMENRSKILPFFFAFVIFIGLCSCLHFARASLQRSPLQHCAYLEVSGTLPHGTSPSHEHAHCSHLLCLTLRIS